MEKTLINFLLLSFAMCPIYATPSTPIEGINSTYGTLESFYKFMSDLQNFDRQWREIHEKNDKPSFQFYWDKCTSSNIIQIKSLNVSSDPAIVPGSVKLSFNVVVKTNISSPLQISLNVHKKIAYFWIKIPCMENVGSCSYSDVCALFPRKCPAPIINAKLPCKCPISQGEYGLDTIFKIPNVPLPFFLKDGDFYIEVKGSSKEKELFCYDFQFSIPLTLE
ncbi:ganglioside GM2 activator-like [Centruroides sculpturatus]|uniref:ganglioside GM2 activator-like n=1 Tax=Centruroides sculpturatus TaxID=218467 RepID=UPI000C6CBE54|nr:ganglioside GM2 activator-like [Centruroides sculpturatus]